MTKQKVFELLEQGGESAHYAIESEYWFYALFDNEIKTSLMEMHNFGGYGEFYEMIGNFNQKLDN